MRRGMRRRDLLRAAGIFVIGSFADAAPLSAPRRLKLKNANTGETFEGTYRDEAGPMRNWELDSSGFDMLLTHRLGPAPGVASRMARLHALARQQYLNRR